MGVESPCTITTIPFTVCSGVTPTAADIKPYVTCSCDDTPEITNITQVDSVWKYDVECISDLGCITTGTGSVDIEAPCTIIVQGVLLCSGVTPTADDIKPYVTCTCDDTPEITNITLENGVWTFDIKCISALGCITTGKSMMNLVGPCTISTTPFTVCIGVTPTVADIEPYVACDCGDTPDITNIRLDGGVWKYDISCKFDTGSTVCTTTGTGSVGITQACFIDAIPVFTWCAEDQETLPTGDDIEELGGLSCEPCDGTPTVDPDSIDGSQHRRMHHGLESTP